MGRRLQIQFLSQAIRRFLATRCLKAELVVLVPALFARTHVASLCGASVWVVLAAFFAAPAFASELPPAEGITPAKVIQVGQYCEGVVFDHDGYAYISHHDTITKVDVTSGKGTVWAVTGAPNGHKILSDATHLVCDASQHAVLRLSADGRVLGAASWGCGGKPLRGPNDLSLDPDGGFYFTDPGGSSDTEPIGTVHYVDARGFTHLVDEALAFPNGIVLTADRKRLYVGESKRNRVLVYDVIAPGKVGPRIIFADLPQKSGDQIDNQPDGMCLDAAGNLYVAHYGMRQVQVLSPSGKLLARYPGGNLTTSNVAFGGPNHDRLYVTGALGGEAGSPGALFRLDLGVKGLLILPPRGISR